MVEPSGWSSGNVVDICIHDIITFSVGFNYNSWLRSFHQNEQEGSEGEAGRAESIVNSGILTCVLVVRCPPPVWVEDE